jgi:tRNA-splicing ligase RtcB
MTNGKDLIDLGFKSGKWFKEALAHINAHALTGDAMLTYLREVGPPPEMPLLPEPVAFFENIRADTAVEQQNIDYVRLSLQ